MRDMLLPLVICWGGPIVLAFGFGLLVGAVWFGRVRIRLERRQ